MKYLYKKAGSNDDIDGIKIPDDVSLNVFTPKIWGKLTLPGETRSMRQIGVRCLFQIISRGKAKIFYVSDGKDLVHTSYVIPKCSKFPFMGKEDFEIGPCFTYLNYRGKGIYPAVLRSICTSVGNEGTTLYMIVDAENIASIKGIERAGFVKCGIVKVTRFTKRYQLEQPL